MSADGVYQATVPGSDSPVSLGPDATYRPGACNIGQAEINRRRRFGHLGALAALAAFVLLIALDAAPTVRFVVIGLLAAGAATGYLQAHFRFCAAFGIAGVFNFDRVGNEELVIDRRARTLDRARALRIVVYALAIGAAIGLIAALLPV